MRKDLPAVGTAELLELLSAHVPDHFINQRLPPRRGLGRRCAFSAAQLWRVHLLSPLTGTHSYNGVVRLLPEQRAWRRFAHLSHRDRTPDVRMLHEFRARAGVSALRAINDCLVARLLKNLRKDLKSVAVIDATDLPAATADKKKTDGSGPRSGPPWEHARSNQGTRDFTWATKSIRCDSGSTMIRRRFV